jgi:hypothetical protein
MGRSSPDRSWLQGCVDRLSRDGFSISQGVAYSNRLFKVVAHRSRLELTKFGNSETLFVFAEVDLQTPASVRHYSADAFRYANQSKHFPLPCGVFESVWCFPVAIVETVAPAVEGSVRFEEPARHWGAAEIPVIYERKHGKLCYFEKTPVWGCAYYAGFRSQIKRYLGH